MHGADRTPAAAPAAAVEALVTIPTSTFDRIGTGGEGAPFAVTAGQPPLGTGRRPRLVYEGAEYCPFCAVDRYALVAALGRFGTFANLRVTASGDRDGDIPTFSFLDSRYTSRYVTFTPYEAADRLGQVLQPVPPAVDQLFATYAGDPRAGTASRFGAGRWQQPGIPFVDLGNRYVAAGTSAGLAQVASSGALAGDRVGIVEVARAVRQPTSRLGERLGGTAFVVEANYLSAGVCALDGGRPARVCASGGVRAAGRALAAVPPIR